MQCLFRELGAPVALLYALDRVLRRFNRHWGLYCYHFMAQPLSDQSRLSPSRGKGFSFRLLQSPDPVLERLGRPQEVIQQRFAQGAHCLMASKDRALVGCIWFVRDAYLEDEVRVDYLLPLDGHCVWDFDVFVDESERLGFLFAKLWDAFDALLKPSGVRYTVSRINAFNQRSIGSHHSLGARNCGWALFLCLGSLQWMLSSHRPYIAFGGRPRLYIHPASATTANP